MDYNYIFGFATYFDA